MSSVGEPTEVQLETLARDLAFPEGPVAFSDGSVGVVEMARQTFSLVRADGEVKRLAHCGGGPNGAARGPDGRIFICNNGGFDEDTDPAGHFSRMGMPRAYEGGSIQVVEPSTGSVKNLYTTCEGNPLRGPNDLVFDAHGGFWFTDFGKTWPRYHDHGGLYYATADGSVIREVVYPLITPNGVALSPTGDQLFVAETEPARVLKWRVTEPGHLHRPSQIPEVVYSTGSRARLDSMAVDAAGWLAVAVIASKGGGLAAISPDGDAIRIPTGDRVTTNICFGGPDLRTAYITCSASGTLKAMRWPRPGLRLNFQE